MRIFERVVTETPFIRLVELDYDMNGVSKKWYGIRRTNAKAAVVIAALTDKQEVIFVTQPRPMIGGETIEFPAGLMDIDGEDILECAARELLEETGYEAKELRLLLGGARGLTVSAGITDERLYLVFATGATKVAEPLTNEGTEPIVLPLRKAFEWISQAVADGKEVDYKMFGAIRLLEREVQDGSNPEAPEVTE